MLFFSPEINKIWNKFKIKIFRNHAVQLKCGMAKLGCFFLVAKLILQRNAWKRIISVQECRLFGSKKPQLWISQGFSRNIFENSHAALINWNYLKSYIREHFDGNNDIVIHQEIHIFLLKINSNFKIGTQQQSPMFCGYPTLR